MIRVAKGMARHRGDGRGASSGLGELRQELDLRVFIEAWEKQTTSGGAVTLAS